MDKSVLQIISDVSTAVSSLQTTSLPEVTKMARFEPLTVVSKEIADHEDMPDILQSTLNIVVSYYLSAASIMSSSINGVRVSKILNALATDRSFTLENIKDSRTMSIEAYEHKLPKDVYEINDAINKDGETGVSAKASIDTDDNLAVGKLIEIELGCGKEKVKIPVTARLNTIVMPSSSAEQLLSMKSEDTGFFSRIDAVRSGRISFWKDFVLCKDLIKARKKALVEDSDGVYADILAKVNKSKAYGLVSGNPSLVSASNVFVISETAAKNIGMKLGGKFSNMDIRQKAFEGTYAMLIVVFDRDAGRVTFYADGIANGINVSTKEIKSTNKNNKGPNMVDILKAFTTGAPAAF